MKSIFLIAALILSATAEPQKTIGQEVEQSPKKTAKLQFTPADAQLYTGSGVSQVIPEQVVAGNIAVSRFSGVVPEQVIPGYYASGPSVIPGVVNQVYPGVVPYSSAGRTVVTSTSQNGVPTGTVYEHHGTAHIGHTANAVHIKRPGQLYAHNPQSYYSNVAQVPTAIPQGSYSAQPYYNGQVQYINGQPAQYLNGQWYYVQSGSVPQSVIPGVNQYSSVYTNLLNRPNVVPGSQTYQQTLSNSGKVWNPQTGTWSVLPGYTSSVTGYRPANDNKWYTKTNTQQVVQPFYGQPQYQQVPAAAGTKSYAVPKPDVESEKADW